jgi:hypothetical protein
MDELNFYKKDFGLETINDEIQEGGSNSNNLEGGDIVKKYRKRCLEHAKKITELEKENKLLKQKIKELTK